MTSWADNAARLDAAVDARLADTISYADDGTTFVDTPGFVIDAGDQTELGFGTFDPMRQGKRVKINQSLIMEPHAAARLRHPRLGTATYMPANAEPSVQGRYWIFDVEEAP